MVTRAAIFTRRSDDIFRNCGGRFFADQLVPDPADYRQNIALQYDACRKFIAAQGWEYTCRYDYITSHGARSRKGRGRFSPQAVIADAHAGAWDVLVIYSFDRWALEPLKFFEQTAQLLKWVKVAFVHEGLVPGSKVLPQTALREMSRLLTAYHLTVETELVDIGAKPGPRHMSVEGPVTELTRRKLIALKRLGKSDRAIANLGGMDRSEVMRALKKIKEEEPDAW